jgi:CubicO group peptidase (beta-lactamase class C family)
MRVHFCCFASLALLCATANASLPPTFEQGLLPAQTLAGAPPQQHTLAGEMARLHVPGVSIAIIHDGKIIFAKGYGVTRAGGAPVTATTLFQAASLSKPVTAVAALRMVQDGKLALDQPANSYLTSWKLPADGGGDTVTLRQLLSHTAGVSVGGFPGYAPGTPVPTLTQVLDGIAPAVTKPVRVAAAPGTEWRYSGGGFTVLQQLMIDVDKQPFDKLMARRVLLPLGMKNSSFTQPASPAMLARAAMPHDTDGKADPAGPNVYPELAAAGLWTTPTDLATLLIAVQKAAGGQAGQLLSPATARTMLQPVKSEYALGFGVVGTGAATAFTHGGHNKGYENTMVAYTGRGDGVVVMTNGDKGGELTGAIVRAVAHEYDWPSYLPVERKHVDLSPAQSRALAGKYAIKDLGDFDITYDNGALLFWLKAGQSEPLIAETPASLFIQSKVMNLQFDTPDTGRLLVDSFALKFERVPQKQTAGHPAKE